MMKKYAVIAAAAMISTACVLPVMAEENNTAEVLSQYDLTSEDIEFVANIFKQYNEGNDMGLNADDYYGIELKLAKMGADLGNGELALWVGEIYQGCHVEGLTEAESIDIAIEWWEKAAELGQPRGWTNIGLLYEHATVPGGGNNYGDIEQDMDTALEYLLKGDEAGDSKAPRYLALLYESSEDYENALIYYEKAAGLGDTTGKYYVGQYYLEGKGTDVDYEKAYEYLSEVASSKKVVPGVADARYSMGYIYENGLGVEADLDAAIDWYTQASENGSEEAAEALARLAK